MDLSEEILTSWVIVNEVPTNAKEILQEIPVGYRIQSIGSSRASFDRAILVPPPLVSFEPYEDGFGIMQDAQTAKPQTFWTRDGWFAYNLAANLAQLHP